MREAFHRFAIKVSDASGSPWGFALALSAVIIWAISGPFFGYSEIWQLAINTGTTIVTFLMVFLIQHAQDRDTKAIHAKLDEIIRSLPEARDQLIRAEGMAEDALEAVRGKTDAWKKNEDD